MNRAAKAIAKMYPDRGDQGRLSREFGLSQGYVSKLISSQQTPGTTVRRLFWERKRIPMHWWDEPAPSKPVAHSNHT